MSNKKGWSIVKTTAMNADIVDTLKTANKKLTTYIFHIIIINIRLVITFLS